MTWRLPWVSRARLEAAQIVADERMDMLAACRARVAGAEADRGRHAVQLEVERERYTALIKAHEIVLATERDRFSALVAQVVELKKLDYGPVPVIPLPPQRPVTPIPAAVMANIARVTEPETRERRIVEKRVRDLLGSGVPDHEVAKMVLVGEEIDEL